MVSGHGMDLQEKLDAQEMADEFLVMGMRLAEGISLKRYQDFGVGKFNGRNMDFLKQQGFIEFLPNGNLRATPSGFLVLDAVVADLAVD